MEITHWHKLAHLYISDQLELAEIVKVMIINSSIGIVEHEPDAVRVGVNVLDNSGLNDALILGFLSHQPKGVTVTYATLAQLLKKSSQTVSGSINRWIARGVLTKEDRGVLGAVYTIHEEMTPKLPIWLVRFTEAIIQLHHDSELRAAVVEETKDIEFTRGFGVMREELTEKFYRRPRSKKS